MKWLFIILGASFIPIWRQGEANKTTSGLNLWQYLAYRGRTERYDPFGHPHIPYEEALSRAQEAYKNSYETGN